MAVERVMAPQRSREAVFFFSRSSFRKRARPAMDINPRGTLMKNIQRQDRKVTMKPPSVGPSTLAIPQMELAKDMVLARSRGGEISARTI